MTDAIEAAAKALAPFIGCSDAIHREAARAALLAAASPPTCGAGFPPSSPSEEEIARARDAWWRGLTRQGDPAQRPNLTWEAFDAGYRIAAATLSKGKASMTEYELELARTAFDRSLKHGAPGLSEVMREAIISGAVRNIQTLEPKP